MPVNDGAFDAINSYPYPSESYQGLYSAIKIMRESYTPIVKVGYNGFSSRANNIYEDLRTMLPSLQQRYLQGEDIDDLVEETWDLFCTVP